PRSVRNDAQAPAARQAVECTPARPGAPPVLHWRRNRAARRDMRRPWPAAAPGRTLRATGRGRPRSRGERPMAMCRNRSALHRNVLAGAVALVLAAATAPALAVTNDENNATIP